ncbi:MAG: UDP-N-acetylmuramoyl-L-alanyl-D-glutamate--2,6-diaminopimelate ligase [Acidimicrobiales bacterium]
MRLDALIDAADLPATPEVTGSAAIDITAVVQDTRAVVAGALFCCIRGSRVDGHDLAVDAVAAGAAAVLAERRLELDPSVSQALVPDTRAALGPVAAAFWGHPSRSLTVVGVTGTNGKTTVTHLLGAIFTAAGQPAEVIGTLTGEPGDETAFGPRRPPTTPEATELQQRLAAVRDAGTPAVAMEVSSHGLALRRVDGTWFAAAVFTNLSQDHLDLHGSMEAYFAAKARLFEPAFTDLAVVNLDDPHGRLLQDAATVGTIGYTLDEVDRLELSPTGSRFVWRGQGVQLALAGRFNVSNAVAAATVAAELGIPEPAIAAGLAAAGPVRGRFEAVDAGQPFGVVVDYAHTPDGLAQLLASARELVPPGGRLLVVFGCGGDRDPGKRPRMGEVAARLADRVVVTSDNPRSEDLDAIIEEILRGIADRSRVSVDPDRRAAIALAITGARPGDLVLLAGKGHETTQTFADRVVPFDDRQVATDTLLAAGFGDHEDGTP